MDHAYWKVSCVLPEACAPRIESAFEGLSQSVSAFEIDEKKKEWQVELLCTEPPDMEEIDRRVRLLAALHNAPKPYLSVDRLEPQDWLAQVARDFPSFTVGRFFIHGAHIKNAPPPGSINIQIDAGAAFGSGEHGTTRTCLEALDWLAKKRDFSRILDMGCGSGILGIAAAKLWRTPVLAVDIDPVAVRVTLENARINRAGQVDAFVSDGYAHERIKRSAPYDLIISNILARPLVAFAPKLAQYLAPGGVAVLSGLLASQEAQVRSAHQAQELTLLKRFADRGWHTLVIGKKS